MQPCDEAPAALIVWGLCDDDIAALPMPQDMDCSQLSTKRKAGKALREMERSLLEKISEENSLTSNKPAPPPDEDSENVAVVPKSPWYSVSVSGDEPTRNITVWITIPGITSAAQLDLDVSIRELRLECPGVQLEPLVVRFPFTVSECDVKAKFDKATHQLSLNLVES